MGMDLVRHYASTPKVVSHEAWCLKSSPEAGSSRVRTLDNLFLLPATLSLLQAHPQVDSRHTLLSLPGQNLGLALLYVPYWLDCGQQMDGAAVTTAPAVVTG